MELIVTILKKPEIDASKNVFVGIAIISFSEFTETDSEFVQSFMKKVKFGIAKKYDKKEENNNFLTESDFNNGQYYSKQAASEMFKKLDIFGTFVLKDKNETEDKWLLKYSFVKPMDMFVVEKE